MADRSHLITNTVTPLIDWFSYRDQIITELTQAGYTGFESVIYSQFTPDHFHNMDELAGLLTTAISAPTELDEVFRAQNSPLEMALAVNSTRDLLNGIGAYDSATGWTVEAGWSVSGGEAVCFIADGVFNNIIHSINLDNSFRYLFEFEITSYTSGGVNPRIFGGDNLNGPEQDSAGLKQIAMSPGATPTSIALGVAQNGGFAGNIDNFKLRKLG